MCVVVNKSDFLTKLFGYWWLLKNQTLLWRRKSSHLSLERFNTFEFVGSESVSSHAKFEAAAIFHFNKNM